MGKNNIKYTLNGQLVNNTLSKELREDKFLTLVSAGNIDKERVISEIMESNPGMPRETVEAIINLEHRTVQRLAQSGYHVNMGLYQVVAQFTGVVENKVWNPERNSVYACFTQGSELRDVMSQSGVNIIGEKGASMYVAGTQNTATRATNATATAGRNFCITGAMLKVVGSDPLVGITLTNASTKTVTKITPDMWAVNDPSRLIFLIPDGLSDGEYTLRITTQFSANAKVLLKTPRTVESTIIIGDSGGGGGDDPMV